MTWLWMRLRISYYDSNGILFNLSRMGWLGVFLPLMGSVYVAMIVWAAYHLLKEPT